MKVQIQKGDSYKIGIDEVVGLKSAMTDLMKPIQTLMKDKIYWSNVELDESEYKSRDGFIPHTHNCGGIEISEIIPQCEEYEFGFLNFGECDGEHGYEKDDPNEYCNCDDEGNLSAKLRVWFKFEGYDESTRDLNFYLYLGGGNGDAPYFRTKHEDTYFEASFSCKSVAGLKRVASKHFKNLIKAVSK